MIGSWMISRTGGPALFVEQIVSDRVVVCSWMDPMGQHKTGQFGLDSLEPLEARPVEQAQLAFVGQQNTRPLDTLRRLKARLLAATFGPLPTR